MTKEEALNILIKMRAWREWGKEQKEEERPEMPEQKEVSEAFDVCIEMLSNPSLPSNLDEAAEEYKQGEIDTYVDYYDDTGEPLCFMEALKDAFKSGAKWLSGQGEIFEEEIYGQDGYTDHEIPELTINPTIFEIGDKVVVQIRKK